MTRDRAKTVKVGDLVSYTGKDNLVEIRDVYCDSEHMKMNHDTKGCTLGAVIEHCDDYEIHQRLGSRHKNPFGIEDNVMTIGRMCEFDEEIKEGVESGRCILSPGQHGKIINFMKGEDKVLVEFWGAVRLNSTTRRHLLWINYQCLAFTDKPTPRDYITGIDAYKVSHGINEELLLLI